MQGRDIVWTEGAVGSGDLMAAWLASGGAIEAPNGIDGRDRQDPATADEGLRAVMNTALASCGVPDDGFFAGGLSYRFPCIDPALQAFGLTRGGIQAC